MLRRKYLYCRNPTSIGLSIKRNSSFYIEKSPVVIAQNGIPQHDFGFCLASIFSKKILLSWYPEHNCCPM